MTTHGAAIPDPGAPPAVPGPSLPTALTSLRTALAASTYPLALPSADEARRSAAALVAQIDDYLLPRLGRLDAPLLVVVGGSTGAGKSTLVNSLVRARVSTAGVLRPTTRSPVLICGTADSTWFRTGNLLPGLTRTIRPTAEPDTVQIVTAPALPPGLAFLDAPDIDSVVEANRALAGQLLAAADLWLFVTTAARYADAVPWEMLRTAQERGTVVALVLDRVPPGAADEVATHLAEMLTANDFGSAPLFVLNETEIDGQGLLPDREVAPLREWFARLAADSNARSAVVRQTLDGALAALNPVVQRLATAADEQQAAVDTLTDRVRVAYRNAYRTVEQSLHDGKLLRGEVLARWQEFVGAGEWFRSLQNRVSRVRDRVVAATTRRPVPATELRQALGSELVTLICGLAAEAAENAYSGWQAHPVGVALGRPELARPGADLTERVERLVRDWQRDVLELVRTEGQDKRFIARTAAYAVNATGLAVMVAVFASTAFLPTGLEVATGAGTTVAAQAVLQAVFGDQAVRTLANQARKDLLTRIDALFDEEAERFVALLAAVGPDDRTAYLLRESARTVETARTQAGLTS